MVLFPQKLSPANPLPLTYSNGLHAGATIFHAYKQKFIVITGHMLSVPVSLVKQEHTFGRPETRYDEQ